MFWDFKHLWLRLLGLERLRVQDVRVFLTSWFPACACAANVAVKDILKKMQDSVKRSSKSDWGPLTTMGTTGRVVFYMLAMSMQSLLSGLGVLPVRTAIKTIRSVFVLL